MQFGLNEAALLLSLLVAAFFLHPLSTWSFTFFRNWLLALLVWLLGVAGLFAPALLLVIFLDCSYRSLILLAGLAGGSLLANLVYRR